MPRHTSVIAIFAALTFGCADINDAYEGVEASTEALIVTGTPDGVGVLRLLNDPLTDLERLDIEADLDKRSARGLMHHRNGPDGVLGTWDDALFGSIEEVDAVKWVGEGALLRLLAFADKHGYVPIGEELLGIYDGVAFSVAEAYALLDLVNVASLSELDYELSLNARAAKAIVVARPFATLADLAATRYVGRSTLARLGVAVPSDAPVVTLQTANGQVEAPLVLIDAVWLGEERIDWATVAVCEACADGGVSGLLGLNVTGLFQVALDHKEREIDLTRRAQHGDRHEDVTHWVQLDSTARVWTDRRVEVDVTAENRSRAAMDGLTVEVACHDRSFAVALEPLEPGAARTAEVALPRGTDCREYRVMLREGRWQID